eukprot:scaffold31295_cov14-Tisochrysis_lutea.AAC.1
MHGCRQIAKNKSEAAKGPLHKGSFFGSSKRNKVQHDGTSSNEGSSRIKAAMPMAEGDGEGGNKLCNRI